MGRNMLQTKSMLGFIFIPFILSAQTIDFEWLVGTWKLESGKVESYEEWKKDGHRLKGESYRIHDGQKHVNEVLFIERFADQWVYIAMPKGQTITLFASIHSKDNTYIFENKEHDFPKRIIYSFTGKDTINAAVEGNTNGENKRFEFKLIKVDKHN